MNHARRPGRRSPSWWRTMSKYRIRNFVALTAKKWLVELGWLIYDVDIINDICWYWSAEHFGVATWVCALKWGNDPTGLLLGAPGLHEVVKQTDPAVRYSWDILSVWLQPFPYNSNDGCRSVQNQSTQLMFSSPPRDWTWQHHMKKIEARQIFAFRECRNERRRMGYQDVAYTAAISLIHMQQRLSSSLQHALDKYISNSTHDAYWFLHIQG